MRLRGYRPRLVKLGVSALMLAVPVLLIRAMVAGAEGLPDLIQGAIAVILGGVVIAAARPLARISRRAVAFWEFWAGVGSAEPHYRWTFYAATIWGIALIAIGVLQALGLFGYLSTDKPGHGESDQR